MAKSKKVKTVVQEHSKNFDTLSKAFQHGHVALMDCIEKSTGEHVAVIVATQREDNGDLSFVPFAKFFNGNPYELLINPDEPEYKNYPANNKK